MKLRRHHASAVGKATPFDTAHKKGRLDRPLVIKESAEIHIRAIRLWMCRKRFSDGARGA